MQRLYNLVQRTAHSRLGAFLQGAAYLLLTAGLVTMLMAIAACDCNDNGIDDCDYAKEAAYQARLHSINDRMQPKDLPVSLANIVNSTPRAAPGEQVQHLLGVDVTGGTPPARVIYRWTPPAGAANLSFPGRQPEPGGPPYVFDNVPPDEQIPVEFDLPTTGPYGGQRLTEVLTAQPEGDLPTTAYYVTNLSGAASPAPAAPAPAGRSAPGATADMWTLMRWYGWPITVSSAECQQAVDLLQSGAAFLAISLPEPAHAADESVLLPIYYPPGIELMDYAGGLDVAAEVTFPAERLAFAANALPAAEGRMWAALGVATTPSLTCPAGLETDNWELFTGLTLDLSFMPDQCDGCVLDTYLCYEGQELPGGGLQRLISRQQIDLALEQVTRSAGARAGVHSYQEWGITCAGPLPLLLRNDPTFVEWYLSGASAQWVTPTMPITLPFELHQDVPDPPQWIDLEYRSDLDAGWSWSDGTQTIVPPVSYAGGWPPQNVYLVGTVPAGTVDGLYTTHVTATLVSEPADFRVSAALAWVGDWVAPPAGTTTWRVYLPLLLKQR